MKPKVVLDTNVYISAILFGGRPEEVFLLAKEREIELFASTSIIAELAARLTDKFHWPVDRVTVVVQELGETATVIRPKKSLNLVKADEADNRILECAVEAKADFIVSGDKRHLLAMKVHKGIEIVDCARFLKKMGKA